MRFLMLVLGALVLSASVVAGGEPAGRADEGDWARVTVQGTLHFVNGRGYSVSVEGPSRKPMRFQLIVPENKILVRRLHELEGRRVVVSGQLGQVAEGESDYYLPPHTLYITNIKNPAEASGPH